MTIARAIRVLEEIADRQPVGVSELSRRLGLSKSSVQRCVLGLEEVGWLLADDKNGKRRWSVGPRARRVGVLAPAPEIRALAIPAMRDLYEKVQENVHLAVREGGFMVVIDLLESRSAVRVVHQVGERAPLYASSAGKAVLSVLPQSEVMGMLPGNLPTYTERTIKRGAELMRQLAVVRQRGYAINLGEFRADVATVSAPVLDTAQQPLGAISISMPSVATNETELHRFGKLVLDAASGASLSRWPPPLEKP